MVISSVALDEIESCLEEVARVHHSAYSKSHFSAWLSAPRTVEYYRCLARYSEILVVARTAPVQAEAAPGPIVGFALGGYRLGEGVRDFVRVHRSYLVGLLLRHPKLLARRVRSALLALRHGHYRPLVDFRLFSIAVHPAEQGRGVGAGLLGAFEAVLRRTGRRAYGLSVQRNDQRTVCFYRRNGFFVEANVDDMLFLAKELT